jgi:hypothetical protein
MPRKPAAATNVVAIDTRDVRLRPPANLAGPERELFVALVAANPPTHFKESDAPLLLQYCTATVLNEQAAAEIRAAPIVKDRPSPWLGIYEKTGRAVIALSMRLRLSPQARIANNPSRPAPPLSAYEKMRLMDEEN